MTGNDQQPTGDPPAAPYRSAAPQQPAGYPETGYPQGAHSPGGYPQSGYPQSGYPQSGYPQTDVPRAGYRPAGPGQAGNPPAAPYGGGPTASGPAAAWTPADARRDTGPVPVVRQSPTRTLDPARLLGLLVAVLGAVNFLWGFLPEISLSRSDESLSVFAVGPAYVPILLLIAGLLALAAFLPGSEVSRLAVAAVSVGGAAGAIVSLGTESSVQIAFGSQASKGLGAILLVIFGIIQAVVAIGAYVVGADVPPRMRGAGPASPATGSARAGGSRSGSSMASGASANPVGRSDQPVVPAPQAGAWSYGQQAGTSGPSGPQAWGVSSAAYGSSGQPGAYPAGGYQPPPAGNPSADEPATGPQFIVGTETDKNPPVSPAARPQTPADERSPDDPETSAAAGRATDAPPPLEDPERDRQQGRPRD